MPVKGNNLSIKDVRNILLIQLGDIGDVVLTLPSIRALREHFPESNIIVAVREKAKGLVEECPWASGVIAINQDKRRFLQEIVYQRNFFLNVRRFNFDLAVDMRRGTRGAILAFLSGAPQRVGFYAFKGAFWRNWLFSHLALPERRPDQYMAQFYLSLLEKYNLSTEDIRPEIHISSDKQKEAIAFFKREKVSLDRTVVALQPFSLWKYKEWDIEKFSRLINWIGSEYRFPVIIIGSPDEIERAEEMRAMCVDNVFNFAGKTSLGMLSAVLKLCGLFIGIDSAGIHIAAAVGTPTVSIFGPGLNNIWAPRGRQHRVVHKDFPCVPCDKKGCNGSEISRCLVELTVDEVKDVIGDQISKIIRP
jgi:lipopolysaccharide heptosyltransferase II